MTRECFGQDFVDTAKFKECTACNVYEECSASATLKGAKGAARVGEVLGFGLGIAGLALGALWLPEMPNGAPWLLLVSLAYLLAVYRAGREYGVRNQEMTDRALHAAEAK